MKLSSPPCLAVTLSALLAAAASRAAPLGPVGGPERDGGSASVELSPLFTEGAVLQRGRPIRVFGTAEPGTAVAVRLAPLEEQAGPGDGAPLEAETRADERGRFEVELPARAWAGQLELRAGEQARRVWLGEVWICSGQSNMEWPLAWAGEPEREVAAADLPGLHLFHVPRRSEAAPATALDDGADVRGQRLELGGWRPCTPETARMFSAVGYHFGRELASELEVPVGLIQCAWGGTPAEAWTTQARLAADAALEPSRARDLKPPVAHSRLYNGMVAPLERYGVAGVIWYQGESNVDQAAQYRVLFPAMIESWREARGRGDLPFLFVQLAAFLARQDEPGESAWAELREAQAATLALPHTGMAVAIDVGDAEDVHPKNKREVGRRLALLALRDVYGRDDLQAEGPTFAGLSVQGPRVRVRFDQAEGLKAAGGVVRGFALAGDDGAFHWAEGRIDGEGVVLTSPEVPDPVAVRYAWADNPEATLMNGAGLPAVPFRTDGPRAREAAAEVGPGGPDDR